ncbi:DUF397 domain-containing protein [Streptomyces sp. NPDC059785]|uniref:DUF397 domain-containing protein n=1 Tax=Streptomyces sp. NPDC059785 TaxID=3346945 RepID=UPI003652A7A6
MNRSDWQRSSFCGGGGNNCVELTTFGGSVALREGDSPTEVIEVNRKALLSLIRAVRQSTERTLRSSH